MRRIWQRATNEDDGFTIVELMAALSVLAIGFMSLAASLGIGFKQITLGRQRQTATEIGNARIEHLRNVPYASVAMSSAPTRSTDIDNPDYYISLDDTQYDVTGDGDFEDLIVDTGIGQVLHLEDPVTIGATIMSVFQYATWADQANSVKRLTVVVVYRPTAITGTARMVRVSSLFTPGTVTIDGTSPGAGQGSGSTPSPTPVPSGSCSGDSSAPSGDFFILSGTGSQTGYTASTTVSLSLSFTDSCSPITARFSNDGTNFGSAVTYDSLNPSVTWTLTSGDGTKSVWGEVWDNKSPTVNKATLGPLTIVLDTTKPTVPGTLSRSISCSGSDRTVHLTWGSSTDTNLAGYRVYQSINSATWTAIGTSSSSSLYDTHKKSLDSVRYYAVGYDKAGNESDATNTIAISKNTCS